jgi:uncharacterized protein YbgA (DUF1722 family)
MTEFSAYQLVGMHEQTYFETMLNKQQRGKVLALVKKAKGKLSLSDAILKVTNTRTQHDVE